MIHDEETGRWNKQNDVFLPIFTISVNLPKYFSSDVKSQTIHFFSRHVIDG